MPKKSNPRKMTADWETKLLQIERSEMEPETFMTEIKEMIVLAGNEPPRP